MRKPTRAEIQVHDLLLDSDPDAHPADCTICADSAATDIEENPVDQDALQRQIDQLTSDLSTATDTIADLRHELAAKDVDEKVATVEAERDAAIAERDEAVADKDKVAADLDALRTEFDTFKTDLQGIADAEAEAARQAQLAGDRKAAVIDLGYTEATDANPGGFVTDSRVKRWAAMDDETWADTLDQLTATKPKAKDGIDPPAPPKPAIDGDPEGDEEPPPANDGAPTGDFKDLLRKRDQVAAI